MVFIRHIKLYMQSWQIFEKKIVLKIGGIACKRTCAGGCFFPLIRPNVIKFTHMCKYTKHIVVSIIYVRINIMSSDERCDVVCSDGENHLFACKEITCAQQRHNRARCGT